MRIVCTSTRLYLFLQALGENPDFSTVSTMTVIERFLKSCSDELSKRLLKYVLSVERKIVYYRVSLKWKENIIHHNNLDPWAYSVFLEYFSITRNTCMRQPLALLSKNANIFWDHEVFVDCCHSNTAIYIFCVFFFPKLSSKSSK